MSDGMRRFLYYDEDSVNSFLAQIERGLITQNRDEDEEAKTVSASTSSRESVTGDLSAKVIGIGASLTGELESSDSEIDATSRLVKGVQEKILHDYAFDRVYNHLKINNLLVDNPNNIGDIVLINENPTFLDFQYFQKLFSDGGIVKYIEDQSKTQIKNTISELRKTIPNSGNYTPAQKAKISEIKIQIKQLEDKCKIPDSSRIETENMIKVIRNTIPYNLSLMTDNFFIPCNDKKFRDDPDIVAFKYGGNISILGFITNIVSSSNDNSNNTNNEFAGFYSTLNQVMLNLFKNKERIFIVHPIALYY